MVLEVVPLVLVVLGLILFLATDSKPSTLGLWMFVIGLFWLVPGLAHKTIGIG